MRFMLLVMQIILISIMIMTLIVMGKICYKEYNLTDEERLELKKSELHEDIQEMCIGGKLFVLTRVRHSFARSSWDVKQIFDTDKNGNQIAIPCNEE